MKTSDFNYQLPEELIAQTPLERRDSSRLMTLDRNTGAWEHHHFYELPDFLNPGDCLILNDSRVLPARLLGQRLPGGGACEVLLLIDRGEKTWECLVRPGRHMREGAKLSFGNGELTAEVTKVLPDGNRLVRFDYEGIFLEVLEHLGKMPLPPYIKEELQDQERYQTVYSKVLGSAAAPTAGLHFTPELLEQIVAQYRAGNRSFSFSLDGLSYYCSTQYNGLVGWYTCSFVEESNLFPGAAALRDYIILLVILCAVAAYILLWFLSRSITRPLDQLNSAMKTVQYKHLNVSLDVKSRDEIGELTESFNYMMGRIHTLVNRVYEEKLAQKNAEIEALQAQINPHFLYNTLDSINWMLIDRDELDISSVVVSLGKLMQYSMDTSSALVPLHMEYRNALDYLNIQKNRLEDRLLYELDLPSDLEDFLIPRLILQPLIENAIIHGILPSGRSGRITVRTRQEGGRLVLSVQDNGDGMEPMQLQQLRQLLSGSQESGSIGMRNVARRLQLHFDGQCRFSVDSGPGRGTTVRLLLPMQGRRMNF